MRIDLEQARQHFAGADPTMASLLQQVDTDDFIKSIPRPAPASAYGAHLQRAIIAQQLSTKAAQTITERVRSAAGSLNPLRVAALTDAELRRAGLSLQKIRYTRALETTLPLLPIRAFRKLQNEEIIARLTTIPGIGVWTAEMFLIFALGRSTVFTQRDLGLRTSLDYYYRLQPRHTKKRARIIAGWHPHETVASLVLWKARDTGLPRP